MKPTLLFLIFTLSFTAQVWCQSTVKAHFESVSHDLGDIREDQGVVLHRFEFTNDGDAPLQVDSVSVSCGCTAGNWSSDPLAVGARGFVEVRFDPHNRPGPFEKMMTVHFKNSSFTTTLKISGFVKPTPESVEHEFPLALGNLRLKSRYLNLGNVAGKRLFSKSFEVYNNSDNILVFSDEMEGPDHITVTFEPYTLKPNSKGKLWVHYDVAAKNELGYYREDIAIFTYEPVDPRKELIITTTLMDISSATGENQPRVFIPEIIKDFGIKQQGDTINVAYILHNKGETNLEIKKAFSSCNCVRVMLDDKEVQPGSHTTLRAVFLTHQRLGNQQKAITVFTNDPSQPVSVVTLKGLLRGPRD